MLFGRGRGGMPPIQCWADASARLEAKRNPRRRRGCIHRPFGLHFRACVRRPAGGLRLSGAGLESMGGQGRGSMLGIRQAFVALRRCAPGAGAALVIAGWGLPTSARQTSPLLCSIE